MADKFDIGIADFFKQAAGVVGSVAQSSHWPAFTDETGLADRQIASQLSEQNQTHEPGSRIQFPRVFSGEQLKMIAFPLGGVAAGSIALGGRVSCEIGKSSIGPIKAGAQTMLFLPSG